MIRYVGPLILLLIFFSCKKKEEVLPPDQPYLAAADTINTYSQADLTFLASVAGYDEYSSYIKNGASALKVEYYTESEGTRILVSGMLYLPDAPSGQSPLLSMHHGTTFQKKDAPTQLSISPTLLLASAGYITFEPDYIGYGSSSEYRHPYYDKTSSAACITDFIKAGKEFLEQNSVPYSEKLFLAGYSEGGYVTLAAHQFIEQKQDGAGLGLDLVAVAAGAGGYDLENMLDSLKAKTVYTNPAYLAFLISSYDSTYGWNKGYAYYFNEPYASKLPQLLNGNHSAGTINSELSIHLDSLLNPSFYGSLKNGGEQFFAQALAGNSLTGWKPESPLRLYHGTEDEVVPYQNSVKTFNSFISEGATAVKMMPINGGDHGSSFELMLNDFLLWFESFQTSQ